MDLSIICVNWNSLAYLHECIASIYEQTRGILFEIVVVDNASPEGGIETLKKDFSDVRIIQSQDNLGFARANNLGFRNSSGQYILLLNPDTQLLNPAVNLLLDAARNLPDAGIVGGKLLNTDLTVQTQSIQTFPTILNQLLNIEFLRLRWPDCPLWRLGALFRDSQLPVQVDVIPGACMLLRRETFERAGMFDESYFMYGEDLDLNFGVKRMGLKNYYIGQARVLHHGGRSSSRQRVSQWSTVMKYKAMLRVYQKNRGRFYSVVYRSAMGLSAAARLALLLVSYPFADREIVRSASEKWATILKWSLGLNNLTAH